MIASQVFLFSLTVKNIMIGIRGETYFMLKHLIMRINSYDDSI